MRLYMLVEAVVSLMIGLAVYVVTDSRMIMVLVIFIRFSKYKNELKRDQPQLRRDTFRIIKGGRSDYDCRRIL